MRISNILAAISFVSLMLTSCASNSQAYSVDYDTKDCRSFYTLTQAVDNTNYAINAVVGHENTARVLLRRRLVDEMSAKKIACLTSLRIVLTPSEMVPETRHKLFKLTLGIDLALADLDGEFIGGITKIADDAQKRAIIGVKYNKCYPEALAISNILYDANSRNQSIEKFPTYKMYEDCIR